MRLLPAPDSSAWQVRSHAGLQSSVNLQGHGAATKWLRTLQLIIDVLQQEGRRRHGQHLILGRRPHKRPAAALRPVSVDASGRAQQRASPVQEAEELRYELRESRRLSALDFGGRWQGACIHAWG